MPPNTVHMVPADVDDELHIQPDENPAGPQAGQAKSPPMQIVWRNVLWYGYLHLIALYGLFLLPWAVPYTWIWCACCYVCSALGITAGAHRLWSHRSYKARMPLRMLLGIFNSMASQNDIIEWSRDHRAHHKFSETDADPHNAKRGFFFSHAGWLLVRKHPEVRGKGKAIDMSDLYADPICAIQRKLYMPSVVLFCFVIPTVVPWYFWGESAWIAFFTCAIFRYVLLLNFTWCVNSVAHLFGNKPYDTHINPVENFFVAFGAIGEGYHNYHHVFPYDYATSESGWWVNVTTMFIDFMAMIGQVSERKKMSYEAVFRRKERTGDGSSGFGVLNPPKKVL
jgi:stearoyl-CoA desaturase (delta-9 desaturase)